MKVVPVLLSLCLVLSVGCGDGEEPSDAVNLVVSAQDLPADDDFEGLYTMGIPRGWFKVKDPVLYTKYFRAQLLRQFGNMPEVHIVADMELKERQWIYPTDDEYIIYLKALYRLFPNKSNLRTLEDYQKRKAEGRNFRLIYADAPDDHLKQRLEELGEWAFSGLALEIQIAIIRRDRAYLESIGWEHIETIAEPVDFEDEDDPDA